MILIAIVGREHYSLPCLVVLKYADEFLGAKLQDMAQQAHFLVQECGGKAAEEKEV